jgi:hypothetical protein
MSGCQIRRSLARSGGGLEQEEYSPLVRSIDSVYALALNEKPSKLLSRHKIFDVV